MIPYIKPQAGYVKGPDGEEYRNLIQQVEKNKEDIAKHYATDRVLADFGIRVVGQIETVSDLPDPETYEGEYGNAYIVGEEPPFVFYIWTRADANSGHPEDYWLDIGQLAIAGPVGPQGVQGPQGPQGPRGNFWFSKLAHTGETPKEGDLRLGDTGLVEVYARLSGGGFGWAVLQSLVGPQGIQGIQGPKGETGARGAQGVQGPMGPVGRSINIRGRVDTINQLPSIPSLNDLSIAYLVGEINSTKHLYIQIGDSPDTARWEDMGLYNAGTMVTTDGIGVPQWETTSKVDKTTLPQRVYGTLSSGAQTAYSISKAATENHIVQRTTGGNIRVPSEPSNNDEATSKQYVDSFFENVSTIVVRDSMPSYPIAKTLYFVFEDN